MKFQASGVASPKFLRGQKNWGFKMFDFRRMTLFCLEKRLSKHKMNIYFLKTLATPMFQASTLDQCHNLFINLSCISASKPLNAQYCT